MVEANVISGAQRFAALSWIELGIRLATIAACIVATVWAAAPEPKPLPTGELHVLSAIAVGVRPVGIDAMKLADRTVVGVISTVDCAECRTEIATYARVAQRCSRRATRSTSNRMVLLAKQGNSREALEAFREIHADSVYTFPKIDRSLDIQRVPTLFVTDSLGRVQGVWSGHLTPSDEAAIGNLCAGEARAKTEDR